MNFPPQSTPCKCEHPFVLGCHSMRVQHQVHSCFPAGKVLGVTQMSICSMLHGPAFCHDVSNAELVLQARVVCFCCCFCYCCCCCWCHRSTCSALLASHPGHPLHASHSHRWEVLLTLRVASLSLVTCYNSVTYMRLCFCHFKCCAECPQQLGHLCTVQHSDCACWQRIG
jgi:hypothetical protein